LIVIDNTVLSDDIAEKHFVCDLIKCKGACCEAGDYGAPLLESEIAEMEEALEATLPYMSEKGRAVVAKQGVAVPDDEKEPSTPLIEGRECAFAIKGKDQIWKCAYELAFNAGKTKFAKPISCHLYPIRITKYDHYQALNYHQWHVCTPACHNGKDLGVTVAQFLKGPLIRNYGEEWYQKLEVAIAEKNSNAKQ
jgi:hypothetical protein